MPISGYLAPVVIERFQEIMSEDLFPEICQRIPLLNPSHQGRRISAIRIHGGSDEGPGVLLVAGAHAREVVNPDLLVYFSYRLCRAYDGGAGLVFRETPFVEGSSRRGKAYSRDDVKQVVDSLDLFVLPLVNPDGREYALNVAPWWRKNRGFNFPSGCRGVDLNRNFDFLWSSGFHTSENPCNEIYRGRRAFSERETRNVRWILDEFSNIGFMVDLHSYGEDIFYPWAVGDDGQDYMPEGDRNWFVTVGSRIQAAIYDVRGRSYDVKPAANKSATAVSYAYERSFVDASKLKVYAFTFETVGGGPYPYLGFQPAIEEANNIWQEVSAGLMEFLLACI